MILAFYRFVLFIIIPNVFTEPLSESNVSCCYRFRTNLSLLHEYCDRMDNGETIRLHILT